MSILKAASLIAVISLLSKVIGLIRDIFIAKYCGLSVVTDAYNVAYLIPGSFALLMLGGLNGPFHSAIVSGLTNYYKSGDEKNTRIILNTVVFITIVSMGTITFLGIKYSDWIINTFWSTLSPEVTKMAIIQLRIMFPMFFLSGLIGISFGVLNIRQHYLTPALSPIMASVSIIALLFFTNKDNVGEVLAIATLIGALLELLIQFIPLSRNFKLFPLSINLKHPGVFTVFGILLPALLSSTIGQVNIFLIQFFAGSLPTGNIAAFSFGNRILQLPLGILLAALLVPLLPILTTAASKNDNYQELKRKLNQGMRSIFLITIPTTVIFIVLGKPIITILFQRGEFTYQDTLLTYEVTIYLSISIMMYAARDLLIRVFYALQDAKTPFYTSFISIVLMFCFCALLVEPLKVGGIALAGSLVTLINFLLIGYLLYRKIGIWLEKESWKNLGITIIASVPVSLGGIYLNNLLNNFSNKLIYISVFSIGVTILGFIYICIVYYSGDKELKSFFYILNNKLKKR